MNASSAYMNNSCILSRKLFSVIANWFFHKLTSRVLVFGHVSTAWAVLVLPHFLDILENV
jgi:hypothetical protein